MSPGQTGHVTGQMGRVSGTDGTHTRGCPAKILYVYWVFFFPHPQILKNAEIAENAAEWLALDPFWGILPIFSGIFPIYPFPLSRPKKTAPMRNSPEGVRDTIRTSPKKAGNPRFGNPRLSFSPNLGAKTMQGHIALSGCDGKSTAICHFELFPFSLWEYCRSGFGT